MKLSVVLPERKRMSLVGVSSGGKSELIITNPGANQSTVRGLVRGLKLRRAHFWDPAGQILAITIAPLAFCATPIIFVLAGSAVGLASIVAGLVVISFGVTMSVRSENVIHAIVALDREEQKNIEALLYANFGDNAGITQQIINSCHLSSYSWAHEKIRFSVSYDLDTSTYSFARVSLVPGDSTGSLLPLEDKQSTGVDMEAIVISPEASQLTNDLHALVMMLRSSTLGVEREHELNRITVDAKDLIRMSNELAKYDSGEATAQLLRGLKSLNHDAQLIADAEKAVMVQRLESHNTYMESRIIEKETYAIR